MRTRKGSLVKHKTLLTGGLIIASLVGGSAFTMHAAAQSTNSSSSNSLASKIASRFSLDEAEVKEVLDEDRAERKAEHDAERRTRIEERLTQAVTDGKLTEEQKTKILERLDSRKDLFDNLKDKTEEERQQALKTQRDDDKKWAEENGIDVNYLMPGGDDHRHGPGHGNRDKGGMNREEQ